MRVLLFFILNKQVVHNANIENFAQQTSNDITVYTTIFHIYNISDKDKGYYQCIISNHFGSAYSQKARINVQGYYNDVFILLSFKYLFNPFKEDDGCAKL